MGRIEIDYLPDDDAPCLCVSGRSFARCCKKTLKKNEHSDLYSKAMKALRKGDAIKALSFQRADLTWYISRHKKHHSIDHAKNSVLRDVDDLIGIDIRALSDHLEALLKCYEAAGCRDSYGRVISDLNGLIGDCRWKHELRYLRTVWEMDGEFRPEIFRRNFDGINFEKVESAKILQMYIDVESDTIGLAKKLELTDRIIDASDKPERRLQNYIIRGSQLAVHGDQDAGVRELHRGIEEFEAVSNSECDGTLLHWYGETLLLLAFLTDSPGRAASARDAARRALKSNQFNKAGKAMLHRKIGEAYYAEQKFQKAEEKYRKSLEIESDPESWLSNVYLAKVLAHQKKGEQAISVLDNVNYEDIPDHGREDYAFALTMCAVDTRNKALLKKAREILGELQIQEPAFRNRRQKLLLKLQKTMARSDNSREEKSVWGRVLGVIIGLKSYLMLKPNIFGVGVNLNQALDNFTDESPDSRSD